MDWKTSLFSNDLKRFQSPFAISLQSNGGSPFPSGKVACVRLPQHHRLMIKFPVLCSLVLTGLVGSASFVGPENRSEFSPYDLEQVSGNGSGLVLRTVFSGGQLRYFRVHIPPSYDPNIPTALILAFHGGGGNARQFKDQSGLNDASDQHGFIVCYPEGTGVLGGPPLFLLETWNAGDCCSYAMQNNIDDVGFVNNLLDAMESEWNIDSSAVFATGHSNGGMMSYRLATELPSRIVAIAPNACCNVAPLPPTVPIPVIAFHGKLDCNVPYQGGFGCGISGTNMVSQQDSLAPFIVVNGGQPNFQPIERRNQAWRFEAPAPQTGADVHYWWMWDHGHAWPGHGSAILNEPTNFDIDINDEMWVFFDAHRR